MAKAHDHDLNDASAVCLRDEENKDVHVSWDNEAKMLEIAQQEIVKALHDTLDRLQIESALLIVIPTTRCMDREIDVFKHGKEDLAKDFLPKFETEDVDTLL